MRTSGEDAGRPGVRLWACLAFLRRNDGPLAQAARGGDPELRRVHPDPHNLRPGSLLPATLALATKAIPPARNGAFGQVRLRLGRRAGQLRGAPQLRCHGAHGVGHRARDAHAPGGDRLCRRVWVRRRLCGLGRERHALGLLRVGLRACVTVAVFALICLCGRAQVRRSSRGLAALVLAHRVAVRGLPRLQPASARFLRVHFVSPLVHGRSANLETLPTGIGSLADSRLFHGELCAQLAGSDMGPHGTPPKCRGVLKGHCNPSRASPCKLVPSWLPGALALAD
mmetsp:Transcript_65001/g.188461  ORF Transcript_65001/g.188461 Transcript_65001/m.188461 type:complete len:283 (+) Transcript_65001:988-1836(+)